MLDFKARVVPVVLLYQWHQQYSILSGNNVQNRSHSHEKAQKQTIPTKKIEEIAAQMLPLQN